MPLFFFDVSEDGQLRRDTHGEQLASLAAAKHEACYGASQIASERFAETSRGTVEVRIRSETGEVLGRAKVAFECD